MSSRDCDHVDAECPRSTELGPGGIPNSLLTVIYFVEYFIDRGLRDYYQFADEQTLGKRDSGVVLTRASDILCLGEALVFDPLAEIKLDLVVSQGRVQQTKSSPKLLAISISYLQYSSA